MFSESKETAPSVPCIHHLATEMEDKQPDLPEVASVAWKTFFVVSVLGQGP